MNLIIDHLEYLLRCHDCVTVPGIGALMVRYKSARFDSRNSLVLLPPSRELVFNGALVESDGVLESSVARRDGISFEAARRIVKEEADCLYQQLMTFRSLALGKLGELIYTEYGTIMFYSYDISGWDFRYYGLTPLYLRHADNIVRSGERDGSPCLGNAISRYAPDKASVSSIKWEGNTCEDESTSPEESRRGLFRRSVVGIAASLAVIVTLALFFINPVLVENEPMKASIAPTDNIAANSGASLTNEKHSISVEAESEEDMLPTDNLEPESAPESFDDQSGQNVDVASGKSQRTESRAAHTETRFKAYDPYCVIVASFPAEEQANQYMSENKGKRLDVLHQDGKFRVYVATGSTYEEAVAQKEQAAVPDAWICRR